MKLFLCVLVAALIALAACQDFGSNLTPLSQGDIDCIIEESQDPARVQAILDAGCSASDLQDISSMVSCYYALHGDLEMHT